MDGVAGGSFRVHLQSLKDFALRLREQRAVVEHPGRSAEVLRRSPDLPLGAFAEAFSLSDHHSDAVTQFSTVLAKVVQSVDFTGNVTSLIAARYEALNADGARGIGAVAGQLPVPPPAVPVATTLPATGTAAPPPGSTLPPQVIARVTVPVPPAGGTVYYYNGSTTVPVSVSVQAPDA